MNIEMSINGLALLPGSETDQEALLSSGFKRPGILKRLVSPGGGSLFEAANPEVVFCGDAFHLYPCTHSYLNRDRQWQTHATVLINGGRLRRVTFHVLDGIYAAPNFLDKFKEVCSERWGTPDHDGSGALIWRDGSLVMSGRLLPDHIRADFQIEQQD